MSSALEEPPAGALARRFPGDPRLGVAKPTRFAASAGSASRAPPAVGDPRSMVARRPAPLHTHCRVAEASGGEGERVRELQGNAGTPGRAERGLVGAFEALRKVPGKTGAPSW